MKKYPSEIKAEIAAVHIPPVPVGRESLRWEATNDGKYTPHSAYHSLVGTKTTNPGIWRSIWRAKVPEKHRFFLWLIQKQALPTNEKRLRNHLGSSSRCPRCEAEVEDMNHLFRDCPQSRELWQQFCTLLPPLHGSAQFQTWFLSVLRHRNSLLGISIMWWTWRWRNHVVFEDESWHLNQVLRHVLADVLLWREQLEDLSGNEIQIPSAGGDTGGASIHRVTVDGSWNPGSGRMGAAAVVKDASGAWKSAISDSRIGGSAFCAELWAAAMGFQHAWSLGVRRLVFETDCKDVVRALDTRTVIDTFWAKEEILQVREWLTRDWHITVTCIPWEKNMIADHLARKASREGEVRRVWSQPPSFIYASLYLDASS